MTIEFYDFDPARHLDTPTDVALYLEAALEYDDDVLLAAVLGDIARAHGMTDIASQTGLSRESLYRSLSEGGNPRLSTLHKVCAALGLKLTVEPVAAPVPVTTE